MTTPRRVVIAGFGPFPGAPYNPSAAVAKALARSRRPALTRLNRTPHVFATAYAAVDRDVAKLLAAKPDIVLIFGLAARRRHLCIETRARNAVSVLLPDASRYRPDSPVIAAREPAFRRGNAPFMGLLAAVRASGVPVRLSRDAGRYLCNYAYWRALQHVGGGRPIVQFVHIPAVRLSSRRRIKKRKVVALRELVAAAERLLVALVAASRKRA